MLLNRYNITAHIVIICPKFTLSHYSLNCIIHALRWIFVFFQESFDQAARTGSGTLLLLPVDGTVNSKKICQFLSQGDQFFVLIKVFNGLRFGQLANALIYNGFAIRFNETRL